MNEIKIFNNPEFGKIRMVFVSGKEYFYGSDVATALKYERPSKAVSDHCKGVLTLDSIKNDGGYPEKLIPEGDMYRLIVKASTQCTSEQVKKAADRFERWIFDEVLPEIRRTGKYEIKQKQDSYQIEDPIERAKRWIEEQEEKKLLEEKVKEQEPKARYFDNLVDSKLLTTFRDTAKEFHISPKELTKWLTDNGYIYRDRHKIIKPYEQHRKSGLFQMKDFSTPYGYSNVQTYITVKGKETFRLLMESQGIIRQ